MPITIGSNIASLGAQRQLSKSQEQLGSVFERLSSGQRINRASDDAAGLSISMQLNTSARIFTQSIRNINDGLSANHIAEGSLSSMSYIVIRLAELAESAANGTYSTRQRGSLNTEAQALREEFNRLVDTTRFNGISLLADVTGQTRIEAGYTANNAALYLNTGSTGAGYKGTGTFQSAVGMRQDEVSALYATFAGDFNNDGRKDLVSTTDKGLSMSLQRADGSFQDMYLLTIDHILDAQIVDINGDGALDVVSSTVSTTNQTGLILFGNGDGTFQESVSLSSSGITGADQIELGDMNGDGLLDIVTSSSSVSRVSVFLNTGNGTFSAGTSFTASNAQGLELSDINNDGKLDVISSNLGGGSVSLLYGTGTGALNAEISIAGLADNRDLAIADINNDGLEDIIVSSATGGTIGVIRATGAGTFAAAVSYNAGGSSTRGLVAEDLNGDGYEDVIAVNTGGATNYSIMFGNSDGTFLAPTTISHDPSTGIFVNLSDINNDGVADILGTGANSGDFFLANTTGTSRLGNFDLSYRGGALAALDYLSGVRERLGSALGRMGSDQSRFQIARNTLEVSRQSYLSANSRIIDSDVAEDSASLVSTQIRQQAAASVLAQANLLPSLALKLLN